MQTVKISVVIAAFNEERLIGKCIEAVKNQTFPKENYEVLVIDNNSTDKTAEIAKEHGATVLFYNKKQGAAFAKQFGVKNAKGEIIAITDADSMPDTDWLETIDRIMQNKKLMCIGGTVHSIDNAFVNLMLIIFDLIAKINQFVFGVSLVSGPNMAVRKQAFISIGGFNTALKTSDDWDFSIRIMKKFGRGSTLYTSDLHAITSPRKQKKFKIMISYLLAGFGNYFFMVLLRKSKSFGALANVR